MQRAELTQSSDFSIRYTEAADELFLRKWLSAPAVSHWFAVEEPQEIEELVKIWISFSRFKCSLTATYRNEPCGIATLFLMPYVKLRHISMGYILVDPALHRKGIGSALIKNLSHLGHSYFRLERMHYEVYGNNPLIRLLERDGYQLIVRQERYVKEEKGYLERRILERIF
jgi:ribosomal protein S18 acetylase RimI-like enzyme